MSDNKPLRIEDPERFPNHSIPVVSPDVGGVDSDWSKRNLQSDRPRVPKFTQLNKVVPGENPEHDFRMESPIMGAMGLQPYQPLANFKTGKSQ